MNAIAAPIPGERYTYADYLTWPDDVRYELIEGEPFLMSAAPTTFHQRFLMRLAGEIYQYLKDKPCEAFPAPFDVRLPKSQKTDKRIYTVVQPDISVICDKSKLDKRGCIGAPDWIIEIVSPSNASHDLVKKLNLYEKHGVREYWIVHPTEKTLLAFALQPDGRYGRPETYDKEGKAGVSIFDQELVLDLSVIFAD